MVAHSSLICLYNINNAKLPDDGGAYELLLPHIHLCALHFVSQESFIDCDLQLSAHPLLYLLTPVSLEPSRSLFSQPTKTRSDADLTQLSHKPEIWQGEKNKNLCDVPDDFSRIDLSLTICCCLRVWGLLMTDVVS